MYRIYSCSFSNSNQKLFINFENEKKKLVAHNVKGGSVQYFKGNHMIYDRHDMLIGNVKHKRYTFLKDEFCKFYNIKNDDPDTTQNDNLSNLWYDDLGDCMKRYAYMNKKTDLLKYTSMPYNLINETCDILKLRNLEHFTPFNIPMSKNNLTFLSRNDFVFGSVEKSTQQSSFINTIYSIANIKKKIKNKFYLTDPARPTKHLFCVPLLPNLNMPELVENKQVLCVIPPNSIRLRSSDHWYDIEYNNIMNKYPIAICVFYNEIAYEVSPINMCEFLQLEHTINKNMIHQHTNLKLNKDILPIRKTVLKHLSEQTTQETIYTDASIRLINEQFVSGIGVWFGCNNDKNISQRIIYDHGNDINYCELVAIYMAIKTSSYDKEVTIYTDSNTSMKLIHEGYTHGFVSNKKYKDIVQEILIKINQREQPTYIAKVKAHTGDVGNTNADLMARLAVHCDKESSIHVNELIL